MPHCTTNFAWYFGKFLLGFTGMLILYMGFLGDKEYAYPCKPGVGEPLKDKKGENDNMCSTCDQRGANSGKLKENDCTCKKNKCNRYANRGRCSRRERCYPRVISSDYFVKSNNAIDLRMHRCTCTKRSGKFLDKTGGSTLLELTLDPPKKYSYKYRWYNSISGHSCIRQKSRRVKKRTCVRIPFSQDTVADLWNVERVYETSHCAISQNNDVSESFTKKNIGQFQDESTNIEKLTQEETTSSSYVDAKNCFVQDACIQTVCEDREETCFERFSTRCEKKEKENTELPKDPSFAFYENKETKLENKHEQTWLNCDCELSIVKEPTNSVNVETSISLEQVEKANNNVTCSVSHSCTCIPYVPELRLESKCDFRSAFNSKYQFVKQRFKENEIECRQKREQEIMKTRLQRSRLCDTRNHWNSEISSPSSRESNRYTSNDLPSSTSTESMIYPRAKMKATRVSRNQRSSTFVGKSRKIGEGLWRRNDEIILKNSTSPLIHKINTKEDSSDRDHNNQCMCRCGDMRQEVISDDKLENTETSRSRKSFSSTSLSSYDRDRSPRSFSRYVDCRCRNLASVASCASTCTGSLASEIEYRHVKESLKTLNPLLLKSTITYGNNKNGRFNVTRLSCQRMLSVMQKRWKDHRERTMNDLYD